MALPLEIDMAICGSRCESIVTAKPSGARTGVIWWMNDGVASKESSAQVLVANGSTSVLGDALDAAGDRTTARKPAKAVNDRQDNTGV